MKLERLEDVFKHELMDLHSAEQQLAAALPKLAEKASSPKLREAFENHLAVTREQLERLKEIGQQMGVELKGETCKGMQGLIEEARHIMEMDGSEQAMDAALIAAAQRVEHYEIAGYGTVCTYAQELGHDEALELLKKTLAEEERTDELLTEIAEGGINREAMNA